MFKSKDDAYIKNSILNIIYCIFGSGNGFLHMILYSCQKCDIIFTITLFFDWIKVGHPHSGRFNFLDTFSLQILSTYFLNMNTFGYGTGYDFS